MEEDSNAVFRERLRTLRAAFGLSQEELAERAGLNYKHYQEIERGGKREIRFSTLVKIARAFRIPLQHLFSEKTPTAVFQEAAAVYKTAPSRRAKRTPRRKSA